MFISQKRKKTILEMALKSFILSKLDHQMSKSWKGIAAHELKLVLNLTGWKTEYLIAQLRTGFLQKVFRLYMSSSFWLLGVESRDFSQAEKERTACKAEQIHKMTTIFTQNDNLGPFWVKIVVILSVAQLVTTVIFFSTWDKSHVKWDNSQNSTQKMRTQMKSYL